MAIINGNSGNNTLIGTPGVDAIRGLAGNDQIFGRAGNDNPLDGGTGNDQILGGTGNDQILGGDGNDRLEGEDGNDQLRGGNGNDGIQGDAGNDQLFGDAGNDRLFGDDGDDNLSGGSGSDLLVGVDFTTANPGIGEIDNLTGGTGADSFALGDAEDVFYDNDQTSNAGLGDFANILDFNSNGDTIQLNGTPGDYRLQSGGGDTRIFLQKPGAQPDELIGIVQGAPNIRLDSNDFLFFEGENAGQAANNTLGSAEGLGTLRSGSDVNISAELATVQGGNPDYDFFEFTLTSQKTVTIETSNSGDTVLGLFNSAGNVLESDDDGGNGVSSLITASLGAGSYSISVSDYSAFPQNGGTFNGGSFDPGAYTLNVSVV